MAVFLHRRASSREWPQKSRSGPGVGEWARGDVSGLRVCVEGFRRRDCQGLLSIAGKM